MAKTAITLSDLVGDYVKETAKEQKNEIHDIITFLTAPWGLNKRLLPAQQFILKLYYNIPLSHNRSDNTIPIYDRFMEKELYSFSESQFLKFLYEEGQCNIGEQDFKLRNNLLLAIGRRGTKTFMTSFICSYEMYKLLMRGDPHKYYGMDSSTEISITAVATGKEQAGLIFNAVQGHIEGGDFFSPFLHRSTQSVIRLRTKADIERYGRTGRSSLTMLFKPTVARGLRGQANIIVLFDEFAHFNEEGQSSDEECYEAATPSVATYADPESGDPAGRTILISSPLNREGKFFHMYDLSMKGELEDWLCIQAPTWYTNPTVPGSYLRNKYKENPARFVCEFGAQFSDRLRGFIQEEQDLLQNIVPTLRPVERVFDRTPHFAGLDLGLKNDGTAIAITHINADGKVQIDWVECRCPGEPPYEDKTILDFDEIAEWIVQICQRYVIQAGSFDHYNGIALDQALKKRGLKQFEMIHATRNYNSEIFTNLKLMMLDNKLCLYDWPLPDFSDKAEHCPYIEELLELQEDQISKYLIAVHAPGVVGKHDDMSDAIARSVYLACQHIMGNKIVGSTQRQSISPNTPIGSSGRYRSYKSYHRRKWLSNGAYQKKRL